MKICHQQSCKWFFSYLVSCLNFLVCCFPSFNLENNWVIDRVIQFKPSYHQNTDCNSGIRIPYLSEANMTQLNCTRLGWSFEPCVCVGMSVCECIHRHKCMHVCLHAHVWVVHVCISMYNACMCVCINLHMHVCACVCLHVLACNK